MFWRLVKFQAVIFTCVTAFLYETEAGQIYDMSFMLSQPHPFDTPKTKSQIVRPLVTPSRKSEGQGYVRPILVDKPNLYIFPHHVRRNY